MRKKLCAATLAALAAGLLGWTALAIAQSPSPPPLDPPNWSTAPAAPVPARPAAQVLPKIIQESGPSLPSAPVPAVMPALPPASVVAPTSPTVKPPVPAAPAPLPPTGPTVGGLAPPARPTPMILPTRPDLPESAPPSATVTSLKPSAPTVIPPVNSGPPITSGPRILSSVKPTAPERPTPPTPVVVNSAELPLEAGPGVSDANPTGRQEPAVTLEWLGPPVPKVGQPAEYTIVVRNACTIAVQQVMVRAKINPGVTVAATEPRAFQEENILMWELGTLFPKQQKELRVRLVCPHKGDVACQAWVTFTGSSALRLKVREPKVVLKATPPERASYGDNCSFLLTLSNPGDCPAESVKLHAELSAGLECAKGQRFDLDIGSLAPGETRSVQVICATRDGGDQTCEATVEAEGGLKARERAMVHVNMPRLDLEVVGPRLRYLDRKAVYTFRVSNPGDAPAGNVTLTDVVPAGFRIVSADSGRHDTSNHTVSWFLGEIPAKQGREVKLELLAATAGDQQHHVSVSAARGLKVEGEVVTKVEGLSALLMEVVDTEDPVEVRSDTTYEVRVTNTGTKAETDVRLTCTIPPQFQVKEVKAPEGVRVQFTGQEVIFEAIPKLAPRADAIYRITVTAVAKGDARFKATLTSTNLVEPVHKEESTRVYED